MNSVWNKLEPVLLQAHKTSQYIGGEQNSAVKDPDKVDIRFGLAFPDTYAIGMSHWGLQVLYHILNLRPDTYAERIFAPWIDMETVMRREKIPLFSLETHSPAGDFDIIGFSLQHELSYTNVLNMLDLAGIPLKSAERTEDHPLIIAGGPSVFNPEPMADFIDIFVIGDGEDKITEFVNAFKALKAQKLKRAELIRRLASSITCLYAPSLYEVTYNIDGTIKEFKPRYPDVPAGIPKAIVADLDQAPVPEKPVIPFGEAIHDRINIEIMRGCPHSCRFCVSSVLKSPLRVRSLDSALKLAEATYQNTGYDEISLLSLSSGDYPNLDELIFRLNARFKSRKVSVSLPSLHISENLKRLPEVINAVRKSGFTIAPEVGQDSLRAVINKNVDDEDLYQAIKSAYQQGWRQIKLYFMIGLPGETDDDIQAIVNMARQASFLGKEATGRYGAVNITISPFVPKPHTPFQWSRMIPVAEIRRKQELIRYGLSRMRNINLKFHKPERSYLEGVFSRGDRRLGGLLMDAWQAGCKFDAWEEAFSFSRWQAVLDKLTPVNGQPPFGDAHLPAADFYALRERTETETLPWAHIESGFTKEQMLEDWHECLAKIQETTKK
ncbi:MAG: TIGR03960 family B12-binding radical SAM protein [Candidatus Brocadiia bacterium]